MADLRLGPVESRFAELIWDGEPISSTELVHLAERELEWKKSTTYTVLKRLCEKGIFQNEGGRRDLTPEPGGVRRPAERAVCGGDLFRFPPGVPDGLHPPEEADRGGDRPTAAAH